jgi:hypothetical protein
MLKRTLPLAVTFLAALMMIVQFFIPHHPFGDLGETFKTWYIVIAAFAIILGVGSLTRVSLIKVQRKSEGWLYSFALLIAMAAMIIIGIGWGMDEGSVFDTLFVHVMIPLSSTMFSLLAFFVASASYRAFRARSPEATLLLATAFIVMLGRVPIGQKIPLIGTYIPPLTDWIMSVPNMAGQRAVMIGAALGVVSASLRVMVGIEKSYLGGE